MCETENEPQRRAQVFASQLHDKTLHATWVAQHWEQSAHITSSFWRNPPRSGRRIKNVNFETENLKLVPSDCVQEHSRRSEDCSVVCHRRSAKFVQCNMYASVRHVCALSEDFV